jgi:translation initiation factor 2-alpha kinase 4
MGGKAGKKAKAAKANKDVVTPSAGPGKSAGTKAKEQPVMDYEAMQDEELQGLSMMFGEDFQRVEAKVAWGVSKDKVFTLRIHPLNAEHVFVLLHVRFTATYPMTIPVISIEESKGMRTKAITKVKGILVTMPKELLGGTGMIQGIAMAIDDIVNEEAEFRGEEDAMPSLEELRAEQEAEALLKAEQELVLRKKTEEEAAAKKLNEEVELQLSKEKSRKQYRTEHRDNVVHSSTWS